MCLSACGSDARDVGASDVGTGDVGTGDVVAEQPSASSAPSISSPTVEGNAADDYCTQFRSFASWSFEQLGAVTAEAATDSFAVRDAYFTEQLERIESMQQVAPAELDEALEAFHEAARLYRAHDLAGAAQQMRTLGPASLAINTYGRDECGVDPANGTIG